MTIFMCKSVNISMFNLIHVVNTFKQLHLTLFIFLTEVRKTTRWTPWMVQNTTQDSFVLKRYRFLCKAPVMDQSLLRIGRMKVEYQSCPYLSKTCWPTGGEEQEVEQLNRLIGIQSREPMNQLVSYKVSFLIFWLRKQIACKKCYIFFSAANCFEHCFSIISFCKL